MLTICVGVLVMGVRCLAITDINYCNLLIYKTKSPLVKKAGNNSVTKRQFYRL